MKDFHFHLLLVFILSYAEHNSVLDTEIRTDVKLKHLTLTTIPQKLLCYLFIIFTFCTVVFPLLFHQQLLVDANGCYI